jgi:pathogenesis-related protein 1
MNQASILATTKMTSTCLMVGLAVTLIGISSNANSAPNFTVGEQAELVNVHNNWRSLINVPMLKWSPTIAETAQNYAESLKSSQYCKPSHSAIDLGENLFWASPTEYSDGSSEIQPITPSQISDNWGSEKADYDETTNTCATGKVCGHYTQIVWKMTAEIGCGREVCKDNSQIWVCNYWPAGNIIGQHPYKSDKHWIKITTEEF